MPEQPSYPLLLTLLVFAAFYCSYLFQKVRGRRLDLIDGLLSANLAILPISFIAWPSFAVRLSHAIGVVIPFSILYGVLFVCVFLILHRLISRQQLANAKLIALAQTVAHLEHDLQTLSFTGICAKSLNVPISESGETAVGPGTPSPRLL